MSLAAKVTSSVNSAFNAVGDLAKSATLSSKSVSGFNFSTGSVSSVLGSSIVSVIIQSTQQPSGQAFTTTALMKSGVDLSVYDTITIADKAYNIIDYTDNGFTIEAIIVKEK
jgi:hypothetical protein